MSIGKKLLFAVIAMVLLSLVVTLFCSSWIFRRQLFKIGKESLESDVTRAANALSVTINKLTIDTQDWAFGMIPINLRNRVILTMVTRNTSTIISQTIIFEIKNLIS